MSLYEFILDMASQNYILVGMIGLVAILLGVNTDDESEESERNTNC